MEDDEFGDFNHVSSAKVEIKANEVNKIKEEEFGEFSEAQN